MSVWLVVVASGLLAYAVKLSGYLVPHQWLEGRRVRRVAGLLPVALLTALVVVQGFVAANGELVLDARAAGLGVGIVALLLRAPFLVVVVLAAATAGLLRHLGWL